MDDTEGIGGLEALAETNGRLPEVVQIDMENMSLRPNELRALKAMTGRTMEELMGEGADDADRMQAMVWVTLRREGYSPTWDEAGDVGFGFAAVMRPDPTPTDTSTGSPSSATSGA